MRLVMVPEYVNGYQQNKEAPFPVAPTGLEFSVDGPGQAITTSVIFHKLVLR